MKTIIVQHSVSDHDIPPFDGIHIYHDWDWFTIDNILELEHGKPTKENYQEYNDKLGAIKKLMFDKWKASHIKFGQEFTNADDDPETDYYIISFYDNFPGITEYLEHFSNYLINDCWTGRGADDDYFDYLPSITDILFQLCTHYQKNTIWEEFMVKLLKLEWSGEPDDSESDPREQCLYRY